ncbi:MAG: proline dehydrogenase family protein [Akkermansia sp.]
MGELDLKSRLADAKRQKWDDRTLALQAAELAQDLLNAALRELKSDERTLLAALQRLSTEDSYRRFIRQLGECVFRCGDAAASAENLRALLAEHGGVPPIFSTLGKLRLKAAAVAARSAQQTAVAEARRVFRSTFSQLTLPTQVERLNRSVRDFAKDGLTPLLNPLVPQVFGPKSAERYRKNLATILSKQAGVGIVICPWRLCPGLSAYSPNSGAKQLAEQLRPLLKLSLEGGKARPLLLETGLSDTLPLVIEALKLALSGADFRQVDIALELPAYLANSPARLRSLTEWAAIRAKKGARPLGILLVKGSHLDEERELSFRHGDSDPVCATKAATETRYKQMLHSAILAKGITPVVGTHNAFDMAYALLDWGRSGREGLPPFCFTAGLANHFGRLLARQGANVRLNAAATPENGDAGFETYLMQLIGELMRPDGVIASGCATDSSSLGWGRLRQHFLAALSGREDSPTEPPSSGSSFAATPLNRIGDRAAIEALYRAAEQENERVQPPLPLRINGREVPGALSCISRSLSVPGLEDYRFTSADFAAVEQVLTIATSATARLPESAEERRLQLLHIARLLEKHAAELIALLVRDAGFTIADADAELNAAIDACRYYERSAAQAGLYDGTRPTPLGVVVVAPGRVHPLADAVGSIAAAAVTGNTIVYKPSYHSVLLGQRLTELLSEAGLSAPVLQMIPCIDNQIARKLLSDPRVKAVLFRGNTEHSAAWGKRMPLRPLLGACTGQPSIYIAPSADTAAAIRELRDRFFTRRSQSPDCPHLVLVHAAVYDNQDFMNALRDAVSGISAAPGFREGGQLGALARAPEGDEQQLLSPQDPEGAWLVAPHTEEIGSRLYSGGVRCGIRPDGLFCQAVHNLPILGLLRVASSEEAMRLQRDRAQGMPVALFSGDEAEIELWTRELSPNSLSVNCLPAPHPGTLPRGSAQGNAPLIGSCDELAALCHWQEHARPQTRGAQRSTVFAPWDCLSPKPDAENIQRLSTAADSIAYWWDKHFGVEHCLSQSPAQRSILRYRPVPVCIRVDKAMSDIDLAIAIMAALQAGSPPELSTHTMRAWMPALDKLGVRICVESREEYESRLPALSRRGVRVRDTAATDEDLLAAARHGVTVCRDSVLANGRLELLHYVTAQVITRRSGRVRL